MPPIRVLIADDHRLVRQGLAEICQTKGNFEIVGLAENGREAVELAHRLKPDVILMDVRMPELDGVQATSFITAQDPSMRVIVLTMYLEDQYVFEAIRAGAYGYMLKDVDAQELLAAVRAVHRGEALIDPLIASRVLDEFRRLSNGSTGKSEAREHLSEGEMAVLRLVAQGADNSEIAAQLSLAKSTISNRLQVIYQKLHVKNRTQAALAALRRGWASLDGALDDKAGAEPSISNDSTPHFA
jgi:DNA-binding NarL/FixJ family response regulator